MKNVSLSVVGKHVWNIVISRPTVRNAVDRATAIELKRIFENFESEESAYVAVLSGAAGNFCAGADLKAIAATDAAMNDVSQLGPMGPTALQLTKPVIAAVEGFAVAGGLELAIWCDLRVAAKNAIFGVFCRRFGVPLIDGGTVRLPRLIGESRAMDLILTGREVTASEAASMGLVNYVVDDGQAVSFATNLAEKLCKFPQMCMRNDRLSARSQHGKPLSLALNEELFEFGHKTLATEDFKTGAARFAAKAYDRSSKL